MRSRGSGSRLSRIGAHCLKPFVPPSSFYTSNMYRAMDVVGGALQLARVLNVPVLQVWRWTYGDAIPPIDTLVKVLEIVAAGAAQPNVLPKGPPPDEDEGA